MKYCNSGKCAALRPLTIDLSTACPVASRIALSCDNLRPRSEVERMSSTGAGATSRVGRNDPCPCGSGKKFKHCCQDKGEAAGTRQAGQGPAPQAAQRQRLHALRQAARKHWEGERFGEA